MTPLRAWVILLTGLLFFSCRKGEKDPRISLNTRKARLAAEWKLTSGRANINYRQRVQNGVAGIYNESFSFTKTGFRLNTNEGGFPVTYVGDYMLSLKIEKDGTFTLHENIQGSNFEAGGTWAFTSGVGEGKNKEAVVFSLDAITAGQSASHLFNRFSTTFVYDIVELRNKKIQLKSYGKVFMNDFGEYITCSTDYEFEG